MLVQLRPNIWLGDKQCFSDMEKIDKSGINRVIVVTDEFVVDSASFKKEGLTVFQCPLRSDRMNPTHLKDLACHVPKYMLQNGDKVIIVSETGADQGAYVAARVICELEGTSIYDVFMEFQKMIKDFDIGKAYF